MASLRRAASGLTSPEMDLSFPMTLRALHMRWGGGENEGGRERMALAPKPAPKHSRPHDIESCASCGCALLSEAEGLGGVHPQYRQQNVTVTADRTDPQKAHTQ